MNVLLDTHIILWALKDDPKLPKKAKDLIDDLDNRLFYSTAAIWEVEIKHQARPNDVKISGRELSELCKQAGYEMLPILDAHVSTLETLKRQRSLPSHNDPFDRIMLAQAKSEGLFFVTADTLIPQYNESCVIFV